MVCAHVYRLNLPRISARPQIPATIFQLRIVTSADTAPRPQTLTQTLSRLLGELSNHGAAHQEAQDPRHCA
jgi:hypothetical protein